ncbi:MAG: ribosome biogenesis GTP-binding protein YihA/YsxC [Oscillospiraceae bacterium]|nr:ribosome biogenesis GTP-binding protein YihA/YsxC [Oscillospiraceae bacterium]
MSDKKINFNNTKLITSAGFINQILKDKPHIVFSGRSNVGKSTLINKLVNQNKLARTSSSPGKTITINFFETEKIFYLVDLPGYGYAKRAETDKKKWSDLVEGYFKENSKNINFNFIKLIVQLVDLKVSATIDDLAMIEYMNTFKIPYIIVATKADKLNKTQREINLNKLKSENPDKIIIPFSSLSGEGINEIKSCILNYIK